MHYTSSEVYEFISKQIQDPIVERKVCTVSGTQFPVFQSDLDFYTKISPTFADTSFQVPTPNVCPEERMKKRLQFRNERSLYRGTCHATDQSIISVYHPDSPYVVYEQDIWRGDSWNAASYGKEVDFNRPFFEQLRELQLVVPRLALLNSRTENGKYSNFSGDNKDVYMIFATRGNERVLHAKRCYESTDCVDMLHCYSCVQSWNCVNCKQCFQAQ